MNLIKIENWSIITTKKNLYATSEGIPLRLIGNVYGHPQHYEGRFVETSNIIASSGKYVKTKSGSSYILGNICPKYSSWLRDYYPNIDPNNPFPNISEAHQ